MTSPGQPTTMLVVRKLSERSDGSATYLYELRPEQQGDAGPLYQELPVEVNQTLVRDLCRDMAAAVQTASAEKIDHRGRLAGYGQTLYDQLFRQSGGCRGRC
jgi:hypothetical protein